MLEQKHYAFETAVEAEANVEAAPGQSASIKIRTLKELTLALLQEVESLKSNGAFDGKPSLDFEEEVHRFETDLIRWALLHTGGHQRRAARMLNLKVTTLNAKIKRYGIRPHALHTGNVIDLYPEAKQ